MPKFTSDNKREERNKQREQATPEIAGQTEEEAAEGVIGKDKGLSVRDGELVADRPYAHHGLPSEPHDREEEEQNTQFALPPKEELSEMNVTQLRSLAKRVEADVPSRASKDELVEAIEGQRNAVRTDHDKE